MDEYVYMKYTDALWFGLLFRRAAVCDFMPRMVWSDDYYQHGRRSTFERAKMQWYYEYTLIKLIIIGRQ